MNTISNLPKHLYHYTTLEGLKGIISSNALWATHYKYLNDSSEVDYARSIISEALADTIEKNSRASKAKLKDENGSFSFRWSPSCSESRSR